MLSELYGKRTNIHKHFFRMMTEAVFKRKAYDVLKEWKDRSRGSTAMLVEGARRVGKTTLVREFAKNEYASNIIVDFYKANDEVKELFKDLNDLDDLYRGLQLYLRQGIQ